MFEELVPGVRTLDAEDLGIGVRAAAAASHASSAPDAPEILVDHPMIQEIIRLARIFGGVILSGPPGTSKSFFAAAAAQVLAGKSDNRLRFVQFHASYQYEDFMLGFRPKDEGGFAFKEGPFLKLVLDASADPDNSYVLVIDELSRADVGRVFGEALTYVERTKRELPFNIASGMQIKVPSNFVIIATMNPFDRGVDEVDAAFERRFAKISMDPDRDLLDELLTDNGMDETLKARVLGWFNRINGHANKNVAASVGHAYFATASDEASLIDIWEYQLKYLVQRAFRRDEPTRDALETAWQHIFQAPEPPAAPQDATPPPEPPEANA
jgi:5-methylcytosine-specific restriction protein B